MRQPRFRSTRGFACSPAGRAAGAVLACLLVLAGLASSRATDRLHPMDGPDVDCRIRIDEDAVRFQVTMNLAYVDAIVDVGRELEDTVHALELPGLEEALFEHYVETNAVTIDGVEVTPVRPDEDAFAFSPADPTLIALFPRFGARALAKVRLELEYRALGKPTEVTMRWGSYPPNETYVDPEGNAPPVEINAQLRASGVDELIVFREPEPSVTWSGTLVSPDERFEVVPDGLAAPTWDLPVPSLLLVLLSFALLALGLFGGSEGRRGRLRLGFVGLLAAVLLEPLGHARVPDLLAQDAGLPDEEVAVQVFRPLHANIYRAFDYEEEGEVYDALARSVEGPLLGELYAQIYASLVQEEAGGAVSRVRTVDLQQADVLAVERDAEGRPSFSLDATWRIEGVVFHWGHAHVRWNEYRATYGVHRSDSGWRIGACEVSMERRVDALPLGPGGLAEGAFAAEDGPGAGFPARDEEDRPFVLPEGEDL